MPVTQDQMERMFTGSGRFADPINQTVSNYDINNVPMFIAQIGWESANLTTFKENLYYSKDRLLQVFPRYFNADNVDDYAENPEKIANRVYANRMGNGDEASGDGWTYRGRGAIQVTGKDNYTKFGNDVGYTLDQTIAYLETDEGAIMSAGFYWSEAGINSVSSNINAVTQKINGGLNGLAGRQQLYTKAKSIFVS